MLRFQAAGFRRMRGAHSLKSTSGGGRETQASAVARRHEQSSMTVPSHDLARQPFRVAPHHSARSKAMQCWALCAIVNLTVVDAQFPVERRAGVV
eukprot:522263-Pyramimonas_sp.AAC.1